MSLDFPEITKKDSEDCARMMRQMYLESTRLIYKDIPTRDFICMLMFMMMRWIKQEGLGGTPAGGGPVTPAKDWTLEHYIAKTTETIGGVDLVADNTPLLRAIAEDGTSQWFVDTSPLATLLDSPPTAPERQLGTISAPLNRTTLTWTEGTFNLFTPASNDREIPECMEFTIYARGTGSKYSVNDIEFDETDPPLQVSAVQGQAVLPVPFKILQGTIRWGVRA